jgi:hypothetical protein
MPFFSRRAFCSTSACSPALGPFLCRPSPLIAQLTKWLLWPRRRELLRRYRMECRQSWRALASTRGSSRLDNGFPDARYRPRHPGSWIPTKGSNFDHAGGFEEPWNSPFAHRCIAGLGFVCRAWLPPSVRSPEFPGKPPYGSRFHGVARNDFVLHGVALRTFEPAMFKAHGPGLLRASIMREVQREQRGRSMGESVN